MRNKLFLLCLLCCVTACGNSSQETISFNEKDYTLTKTKLNLDYSVRDESYVNKNNAAVTMLKSYLNRKNKIQAQVFYYNKQRFGPYKLYDTSGHLSYSSFTWGSIDSSKFAFDSVNMVLKGKP